MENETVEMKDETEESGCVSDMREHARPQSFEEILLRRLVTAIDGRPEMKNVAITHESLIAFMGAARNERDRLVRDYNHLKCSEMIAGSKMRERRDQERLSAIASVADSIKPVPRTPVSCAVEPNGAVTVVCNDGSTWWCRDDGKAWQEIAPIPGTLADVNNGKRNDK